MSVECHTGPHVVPGDCGVLLASQRKVIKDETGCSMSFRYRSHWKRKMLAGSGPGSQLSYAVSLAQYHIQQNKMANILDKPENDTSYECIWEPANRGREVPAWQCDAWHEDEDAWHEDEWEDEDAWHEDEWHEWPEWPEWHADEWHQPQVDTLHADEWHQPQVDTWHEPRVDTWHQPPVDTLPPMPQQQLELRFFTFGVNNFMDVGIGVEMDIWIDARWSDQRHATDPQHIGHHIDTLKSAHRCVKFWQEFEKLSNKVFEFKWTNPLAEFCNIAVYCWHGRHKSVSWAVLMHQILAKRGFTTREPVHLSRFAWPKNTCEDCWQCRRDNPEKADLFRTL